MFGLKGHRAVRIQGSVRGDHSSATVSSSSELIRASSGDILIGGVRRLSTELPGEYTKLPPWVLNQGSEQVETQLDVRRTVILTCVVPTASSEQQPPLATSSFTVAHNTEDFQVKRHETTSRQAAAALPEQPTAIAKTSIREQLHNDTTSSKNTSPFLLFHVGKHPPPYCHRTTSTHMSLTCFTC